MSSETVEAIGQNLVASPLLSNDATMVWHAGEPLVLPSGWYDQTFSALEAHLPPGRRLRHAFQTNGTLIDDRWIELFRRWNVNVGVSLDGDRETHDRNRLTRSGKGSFDATLAGVRCLQRHNYPFHVISVLDAQALADPDRLVEFYVANRIEEICFNVEELEGEHETSTLYAQEAKAAYGAFLCRVLERLRHGRAGFRCREIEGFRTLVAADAVDRQRNPQITPLSIVSVAVDGTMSTFSPELLGFRDPAFQDFVFGDINTDGPEAILTHPAFKRLFQEIQRGVKACRAQCRYFEVCGGGAPANKYFENGSFATTETLYCRLTVQAVVDSLVAAFENEIRETRRV